MPKFAICTPTRAKPSAPYFASLSASLPILEAAGWELVSGTPDVAPLTLEIGCPYISVARATMLRKALDAKADAVVFIDDDVSWEPDAILHLLQVPDPVVACTYRFKSEPEDYMGSNMTTPSGTPLCREDGLIDMFSIPAGFLKVTRDGVNRFMREYPELCYGERCNPSVDLFNHGAIEGTWYGEDYAFAKRWRERCGNIWLIPNLQIDHNAVDGSVYPGNYSEYLMRRPGGHLHEA